MIVWLLIRSRGNVNQLSRFLIVSSKMVVHLSFSDQVAEMNEGPAVTPHCRSDRLCGVRKRFPRHPRAAKELAALVFIHPVAHVQDKLRCCTCDPFAMGHL